MKPLRKFLDKVDKTLKSNKHLHKLYPVYDALDTFLYTPKDTTTGPVHIRDANDYKRLMSVVVIALLPCMIMAMYNTGLQANLGMAKLHISNAPGWRGAILASLQIGYDPNNLWQCIAHGALYFIPIYFVTVIAGGLWELLFSVVQGHEVNEGFFVTSALFPLTLPATIPLWQVALGISFGVVIGKEIFGGTGRNFLNPALVGRVFLFFAYPAQISGNAVWTAVDGFSGATPLSIAASSGMHTLVNQINWSAAFLGTIQGSMGETSTLACLIGAAILLITGIASWRIMVSMTVSAIVLSYLFYFIGSDTNLMFQMPPHWHLVLGGFAFGMVFMATDPVSSSMTFTGQYYYGALIGFMVILIRVVNPAFPEGTMLAILFGNTFAPLIDHFVVKLNIKRRMLRNV